MIYNKRIQRILIIFGLMCVSGIVLVIIFSRLPSFQTSSPFIFFPSPTPTGITTGALHAPLTEERTKHTSQMTKLRRLAPITTSTFRLTFDYGTNRFLVTLQDMVTKEQFFSWLKHEGYGDIYPNRFIFYSSQGNQIQ